MKLYPFSRTRRKNSILVHIIDRYPADMNSFSSEKSAPSVISGKQWACIDKHRTYACLSNAMITKWSRSLRVPSPIWKLSMNKSIMDPGVAHAAFNVVNITVLFSIAASSRTFSSRTSSLSCKCRCMGLFIKPMCKILQNLVRGQVKQYKVSRKCWKISNTMYCSDKQTPNKWFLHEVLWL